MSKCVYLATKSIARINQLNQFNCSVRIANFSPIYRDPRLPNVDLIATCNLWLWLAISQWLRCDVRINNWPSYREAGSAGSMLNRSVTDIILWRIVITEDSEHHLGYTPFVRLSYQIAIVGVEQTLTQYNTDVFNGLNSYNWIAFYSLLAFVSLYYTFNKNTIDLGISYAKHLLANIEPLLTDVAATHPREKLKKLGYLLLLWTMMSRVVHNLCESTIMARLVENKKIRFNTFDELNENGVTGLALSDTYVAKFLPKNIKNLIFGGYENLTSVDTMNRLIAGTHVVLYREDDASIYVKTLRDKYEIPLYMGTEKKFFQLVSYVYNKRLDEKHKVNLNRLIQTTMETGIMHENTKMKNLYLGKGVRKKFREERSRIGSYRVIRVLTIDELMIAFKFDIYGLILGLCALFCEVFVICCLPSMLSLSQLFGHTIQDSVTKAFKWFAIFC